MHAAHQVVPLTPLLTLRTLPSAKPTFMPPVWAVSGIWLHMFWLAPAKCPVTLVESQYAMVGLSKNVELGPWMSAANLGDHSHHTFPPQFTDQGSADGCAYFSAKRMVLEVPSGIPPGKRAGPSLVQSPSTQPYMPTLKTW